MERVRPQPAAADGRRRSIFTEVGLIDEHTITTKRSPAPILVTGQALKQQRPSRTVRFRSRNSVFGGKDAFEEVNDDESDWESVEEEDGASQQAATGSITYTIPNSKLYRAGLFAIVLALMLPVIQMISIAPFSVNASSIPRSSMTSVAERLTLMERADSPTDVCKRWSGQSAIVNGTLYMYGFRTTTDAQQKSNTWTNDFLTLDLTKSWQISNPSLTGLPQPSGPPALSLGYLYSSHNSLWLYGGQYSDNPKAEPGPNSVWEYDIGGKSWVEHADPKSSAGVNAEGDGQSIQRAAEGAGFGVTALGRGWYFGGHLDDFTTEGWSNQIARVYLKSLLEITFPGHSNDAVDSLKDGKKADKEPVYRNITKGGIQDTGSFPERADGVLTYVPGFGAEGLLIGFTGGDNDTFAQMNVIDVYDIAESKWYKQSTSGKMPPYRVNPCAVVGAALDGSSYNVYMFGGQNLQPYGDQTQKDDMWILSIPSFTWIEVEQDASQSVPPARAGHTCHVWDGQMIMIGGYVGQELSCDSPGIYVFNMSSLSWSDQFTALTGGKATQDYTGEGSIGNPLGQQPNQRGFNASAGVEGSYGYKVPDIVQKVIGGAATGGATLTAPVQTPTGGPLVTGSAMTYTVTGPNGASYTEIVASDGSRGDSGPNVAAIVAGVVAGVFAVIAGYFAFCAWIYRKQVAIWKQHAAMVTAASEKRGDNTFTSSKISSERAPGTMGSRVAGGTAAGSFDIQRGSGENTTYGGAAANWERRSSIGSVTEDLLEGQEPSFWGAKGVLLNPRRSLRVINRD